MSEIKRVTDIIGTGDIEFHSDLPRMDLEDIIGEDYVFCDALIMKDWDTEYGKSDWCLLHLKKPDVSDDSGFTTKCGGRVLVKRIAECSRVRTLGVGRARFGWRRHYQARKGVELWGSRADCVAGRPGMGESPARQAGFSGSMWTRTWLILGIWI